MSQPGPTNGMNQSPHGFVDNSDVTRTEVQAEVELHSPLSFDSDYWDRKSPSSTYCNMPDESPRSPSILEDQLLATSAMHTESFGDPSIPIKRCQKDQECLQCTCMPKTDRHCQSLGQIGSIVVVHPQYLRHHGLPTTVLHHLNSLDFEPRYVTIGIDRSATVTTAEIPVLHLLAHEVKVLEQVIGQFERSHKAGHQGDKTAPCTSRAHCKQADHSPGHPHRNDTQFRQYMLKNIRVSMANISESVRLLAQDDALADPLVGQRENLLGEAGCVKNSKGLSSVIAAACGCQRQIKSEQDSAVL